MKNKDYTGKLGQMFTVDFSGKPHEWEMYSFDKISMIFWNAFANKLRRKRFSDAKIKEILQSRDMRYMLDNNENSDKIEAIAEELASKFC